MVYEIAELRKNIEAINGDMVNLHLQLGHDRSHLDLRIFIVTNYKSYRIAKYEVGMNKEGCPVITTTKADALKFLRMFALERGPIASITKIMDYGTIDDSVEEAPTLVEGEDGTEFQLPKYPEEPAAEEINVPEEDGIIPLGQIKQILSQGTAVVSDLGKTPGTYLIAKPRRRGAS